MPKATNTPTTSRRRVLPGSVALPLGAGIAGCIPTPALAAVRSSGTDCKLPPDAHCDRVCWSLCTSVLAVGRQT